MSVEKWGWAAVVGAACVCVTVASLICAQIWPNDSGDVASWVQAIGSIAAIVGAVWIASDQHRRDVVRREVEAQNASYVLRAEIAWLSGDVVQFLNYFISVRPGAIYGGPIPLVDEDVADLLVRLNWCRQRVEHKGQLAMLGDLRASLVKTVRVARAKIDDEFTFSDKEVANIDEWRKHALRVYNHANEVETVSHYCA